jgi:hypothetical protein
MPFRVVQCPYCGGAESTEFKPGSFVCRHCEKVFTFQSPNSGALGCELDGCGVAAIGRCASCGRRFCLTHQGRSGPIALVDRCESCQSTEVARLAEDREHHAAAVGKTRSTVPQNQDLIARSVQMLLSAKPGQASQRFHTYGRSRFMGKEKFYQCPLETGWPIGDLEWEVNKDSSSLRAVPTVALRDGHIVPLGEGRRPSLELRACGDSHLPFERGYPRDRDDKWPPIFGRTYLEDMGPSFGTSPPSLEYAWVAASLTKQAQLLSDRQR